MTDDQDLLIDLHRGSTRQGPGGRDQTSLAIQMSGLRDARALKIADMGCGSGSSAVQLAQELDAEVVAVDCVAEFLEDLRSRAGELGLAHRITAHVASMETLPIKPGALDAIWSEGAIYNMGFENGVRSWRRYLKPSGILAVTELTWFTAERPDPLTAHWTREYPEVGTAAEKFAALERNGYAPIGYFTLPETCWQERYYRPLQARFDAFLHRHGNSAGARRIVEAEEAEIALYERFSSFFGYGFYIARKTGE